MCGQCRAVAGSGGWESGTGREGNTNGPDVTPQGWCVMVVVVEVVMEVMVVVVGVIVTPQGWCVMVLIVFV